MTLPEEQHVIFRDRHEHASQVVSQLSRAIVLTAMSLIPLTGCTSADDSSGLAAPADSGVESSAPIDASLDETRAPDTGAERATGDATADVSDNDRRHTDAADVGDPLADAGSGTGDADAAKDADRGGTNDAPNDASPRDANPAGDATDGDGGDGGRPVDTMAGAALAGGHHMGTAVQTTFLDSAAEPQYTAVLTTHFDALVAEYQMKWGTTQATQGVFNFAPGDQVIAFASRHGMIVKGHTLVWHQSLPAWVTALGAGEAGPALDAHIAAVVGHWKGKLYAWDVVNEAITDDGAGYRSSIFFQQLGAAFVERAFRAARAADPSALLFYNDYGAETLNAKSNGVHTLVRDLKTAGVPIDGVGLQFHVDGSAPPPLADVATNLDRLIALGLVVNFSEIDIRVANVPGTAAEKLAKQRTLYHDIIALCAARPKCHSASTWGFTDKYTWIDMQYGAGHMPLPFDVNYAVKPAVAGVIDAWLGK
jgi:GH35 family endo-1,4-beta-xylanase